MSPVRSQLEILRASTRGWAGGTCSLARARAVRQWVRRVIERRGDDRMGAPRTHRAQRVRGHTQLQRCLWQTILGLKSWPFRLWSPIRSVHPREPLSHGGIGTCLCQGQAICAHTFLHEFYMQRTYRSGCAHRIRVRAVKAAKSCCVPASLIGVHLGRGALGRCIWAWHLRVQ